MLDVPMPVGSKPGAQELAEVSKADNGNGEAVATASCFLFDRHCRRKIVLVCTTDV